LNKENGKGKKIPYLFSIDATRKKSTFSNIDDSKKKAEFFHFLTKKPKITSNQIEFSRGSLLTN